jgi:hypothetical protein
MLGDIVRRALPSGAHGPDGSTMGFERRAIA